jgi:Flp pilus assembly protein TadG
MPPSTRPTPSTDSRPATRRHNGQVLVIFAGAMIALIGIVAIVVDVSWYWANSLKVQRAADAAALAGAIYLPGSTTNAYAFALVEAKKDGYVPGSGTTITPLQDTSNGGTDPRQLDVTISTPVQTFFARVLGITSFTATRTSKAIYVQPVPMGSPENYYGVSCLTTPSDSSCDSTTAVPNATGVGTLASKGFWGAIQSSGDLHNEGDAFTPLNDTLNPGSNSAGGTNPDFAANGEPYNYDVVVPANGGTVYIFDPTFCPVGGGYGVGDHYNADNSRQWGGTAGKYYSVSTYYTLFNTNNTAFTEADDTQVATSGSLFQQEFQLDNSGTYGTPSGPKVGDVSTDGKTAVDCGAGKIANPAVGGYWHNKWWPIATGLAAGTYRVLIQSAALGAVNFKAQAENAWSIEVTDGVASPQVHGFGRMAGYNILSSGLQKFYLAQIDQTAAGKTIEIDLFDPGDVSGDAFMRVLSPDGNAYNYATFSYSSDANCIAGNSDSCSGSGRTVFQTAKGGSSSFNDTWVKILIPLPTTYGSTGLLPPGETQPGWWKIEYQVAGGNDTTTWEVNVLGNPVHLVVP